MTINSVSDLFEAIENNTIDYRGVLEYILKRESEAWNRGYEDAKNLYMPLLFSDNLVE
jgi:uncharacterized protein YydD (DUF2326 family)